MLDIKTTVCSLVARGKSEVTTAGEQDAEREEDDIAYADQGKGSLGTDCVEDVAAYLGEKECADRAKEGKGSVHRTSYVSWHRSQVEYLDTDILHDGEHDDQGS